MQLSAVGLQDDLNTSLFDVGWDKVKNGKGEKFEREICPEWSHRARRAKKSNDDDATTTSADLKQSKD